jgi:hypothetical protein
LIPLLASDKAGEVFNTAQAIARLLASAELDFHDLVTLLSREGASVAELLRSRLESDQDALLRLGLGASLFRSAEGAVLADVVIDGYPNTWPLSDPEFGDWLLHEFFIDKRKTPASGALKGVIRTLRAYARFSGPQHNVYLRAANSGGKIYLDVGDTEWHAVEIDASGWPVIQDSPVRFRRTAGMGALPIPVRGGSIEQLRPFVNLNDEAFVLFISWLDEKSPWIIGTETSSFV